MTQNRISDWKQNASKLRNDLLDNTIRKEISVGKFGRMNVKFIQGSTVLAELSKSALLQIIADHTKKSDQKPSKIYPLAHAYSQIKSLDNLFTEEEQKLKKMHFLKFLIAKIRNCWNERHTHQVLRRTIDAALKKNYHGAKDEATFYSNAAALTEKELTVSSKTDKLSPGLQGSAEKGVVKCQYRIASRLLDLKNPQALRYLGLNPSLYGHLQGPNTVLMQFFSSIKLDVDAPTIYKLICSEKDSNRDALPYYYASASRQNPAGLYAMGGILFRFHENLKKLGQEKASKVLLDRSLELLRQAGTKSPSLLQKYYRCAIASEKLSLNEATEEVKTLAEGGNVTYMRIYADLLKNKNKDKVMPLLERVASFGCIADQINYIDAFDTWEKEAQVIRKQYIETIANEGIELFQALKLETLLKDPEKKTEALNYLKGFGVIEDKFAQIIIISALKEAECEDEANEYLKRFAEKGNDWAQTHYAEYLLKKPGSDRAAKEEAIRYLRLADSGHPDHQVEFAELLLEDKEQVCHQEAMRYLLLAADKGQWKAENILRRVQK